MTRNHDRSANSVNVYHMSRKRTRSSASSKVQRRSPMSLTTLPHRSGILPVKCDGCASVFRSTLVQGLVNDLMGDCASGLATFVSIFRLRNTLILCSYHILRVLNSIKSTVWLRRKSSVFSVVINVLHHYRIVCLGMTILAPKHHFHVCQCRSDFLW